jgi:signal peptidase I
VFHPPEGALEGNCGDPEPGALCREPSGGPSEVTFVFRVVAVGGDRLRVDEGRVIRNGERVDEPYAGPCAVEDLCTFRGEITIPAGHVYVMGDNREASADSRSWGPVPHDQIVGRADDCAPFGLWCAERDDG